MNNKVSELNNCITAYGKNDYEKELNLQSQYFPVRVVELEGGEGEIGKKSILDLGIGSGFSAIHFSRIVEDYTVLEGGTAIIKKFKNNYPAVYEKTDIVETLFEEYVPSKAYDIIIMGCILEHVDDPLKLLKYYRGYLKQGGKMYLSVPNWEALHKKIAYYGHLIPDMHFLSERDYELGHQRSFSIETFKRLVTDADMECMRTEGIFLKPIATSQMERLGFDDRIYDALLTLGVDYPELSAMLLVQAGISNE